MDDSKKINKTDAEAPIVVLTFSGFKDPHMNINAFFINRTCSEQYSDGIVM